MKFHRVAARSRAETRIWRENGRWVEVPIEEVQIVNESPVKPCEPLVDGGMVEGATWPTDGVDRRTDPGCEKIGDR